MRPVEIKTLRIIAFIPVINILCFGLFLYNCFFFKPTFKQFLHSLLFYLFPAVIVAILREIILGWRPAAGTIIDPVYTYLVSLIVGLRLASYQERYLLK